MAGLSGVCATEDCREPAAALVVTDLEILDDDERVEDYTTEIVAFCKMHAVEELSQ